MNELRYAATEKARIRILRSIPRVHRGRRGDAITPARAEVLAVLHAHGGLRLTQIARTVGRTVSNTEYLLTMLARHGLAMQRRVGNVRYWVATDGPACTEPELEAQQKKDLHRNAKRIYEYIQAHPGTYLQAIRTSLGLGLSLTKHHLDRLQLGGYITATRHGRFVHYTPNPEAGA
jgi:predicted transcriptional regulator